MGQELSYHMGPGIFSEGKVKMSPPYQHDLNLPPNLYHVTNTVLKFLPVVSHLKLNNKGHLW